MQLTAIRLTQEKFEEYGEVIELENSNHFPINQGLTTRFHDLLTIDAGDSGGRAIVNIFRSNTLPLPHRVKIMERHPLGSQAFLPMNDQPFLVLVGRRSDKLCAHDLSLFKTNGRQGINLKKNTWHHFQMVLQGPQDFVVVDRGGDGNNLEEVEIEEEVWVS